MDLSMQQSHVLKLFEGHVKDQNDELQTTERKAQQVLSTSSLIAAFVAALQIPQLHDSTTRFMFLGLIFGTYIITFVLALTALFPRAWKGLPLEPSWDNAQAALAKDDEDFYDWLIVSYVNHLSVNQKVLTRKAQFMRASFVLLVLDIIWVVIAGTVATAP